MRSVAFSTDRMANMVDSLQEKGATALSAVPFTLAQHNKPVAWIVKFKKEM
jgi:hypothetical protein